MKKNLLLICLYCLVSINTFALDFVSGSLDSLYFRMQSRVAVEWDDSKTIYQNDKTLEQFLEGKYSVDEWKQDILPAIIETFIEKLNDCTMKHDICFVQSRDNVDFIMVIKPLRLTKKGNGELNYIIMDARNKQQITVISHKTSGGFFGSIENLMTETFARAGNKMGKFVSSKMLEVRNGLQLRGARVINYEFDFSKVEITDIEAKNFLLMNNSETADPSEEIPDKIRKSIERTFVNSANQELMKKKRCKLDNKTASRYEVKFNVVELGMEGAHKMFAYLVDKDNKNILSRLSIQKGDGKFNDYETLLHEQLEKSGKDFGGELYRVVSR